MKLPTLVFLAVLGFCFQQVNAQSNVEKPSQLGFEIDKVLSTQFKPNEPGGAVLIAREGQIIYKKGFGMADMDLKVPIDANMVFGIGSITNQFTAIAIMQLVEKGKISLNDPITKYIANYPTQGYTIKIEHLLTHTSGIKDFTKIASFDAIMASKNLNFFEIINLIKNEKLDFAPGTDWSKSSTDDLLLCYMIEKVTGKPYTQYIEEHIFRPAGMKSSYFAANKPIKNLAKAYIKGADGFKNLASSESNAARVISTLMLTVEDFFKFQKALKAELLIKKENIVLCRTSYKLTNGKDTKYGYGVPIDKGSRSNIPVFTVREASAGNGFFANYIYAPERDILIAVFTNCESFSTNDPTQNIYQKVLTDTYSSFGFKTSDDSRFVFYHFLLSVKVIPQGGIIEKGKTASVYINGDTQNIHYTTDGSEPTVNSPDYKAAIKISKACVLKVKVIPPDNSIASKSDSFIFTEGTAPEPFKTIDGLKPGLKYSYYEGTWDSIPDYSILTPKLTGIADVPDLSPALANDHFALQFNGYIYIDKDGFYNIYSISDDASQIFLNDKLIVNSNGLHGTVPEAYVMPLKKGYYPIRVLYLESTGGQELKIGYWTEGNEPKTFIKEVFFHQE